MRYFIFLSLLLSFSLLATDDGCKGNKYEIAECYMQQNECKKAQNFLLEHFTKQTRIKLVKESKTNIYWVLIDAYTLCNGQEDISKARLLLEEFSQNMTKDDEDDVIKLKNKIDSRSYTPEHIEKFIDFIREKGFDYILIFLAVFIGMVISKFYDRCEEYEHIKMIKEYLKGLETQLKNSRNNPSISTSESQKCVIVTIKEEDRPKKSYLTCKLFEYIAFPFSFAILAYLLLGFIISIFIPQLLDMTEKEFIIYSIIEIFLLVVVYIKRPKKLKNIFQEKNPDFILSIAFLLQGLVISGKYGHLFECIKVLVFVDNNTFGKAEKDSILCFIIDQNIKKTIEDTFELIEKRYPD